MQLSDKNKTYSKGCSFCSVINAILEKGPKYWGPQPPPKAWKRWTLLFCSVLFSVGIPILIFSLFSKQSKQFNIALVVMFGFFFLLGLFGLVVSLKGCDACVARIHGRIDFTL
jgi:hypothetical protein